MTTYSDKMFRTRSLPEDGCGWVVTATGRSHYSRAERDFHTGMVPLVRYAGGIYRCKDYAQARCKNPNTVCAFVVWDVERARQYYENAVKHKWLDATSIADMMYYFGTSVSRKFLNKEK